MPDHTLDEHPTGVRRDAVRVLVADLHPLFRLGLGEALRSTDDLLLVGEASDGSSVLAAVDERLPDVVVLDVDLATVDGLEVARRVAWRAPHAAVVVLTADRDPERVTAALDAGVSGYLLKTEEPAVVLAGVRAAAAGHLPISAELVRDLLRGRRAPERPLTLTGREEEILRLVASGMKNKQIGKHLGVSDKTVKAHLTKVFRRIDVKDRSEAAAWAAAHLNGSHPTS